jgi:hypothetical protein
MTLLFLFHDGLKFHAGQSSVLAGEGGRTFAARVVDVKPAPGRKVF